MSAIESELGTALHDPVKRKRNNTGKLRSKAARVAKGVPEVMVKITGFGKGAKHVQAHLDYITRNGKVEMENDRGEVFKGKDQVRGLFKEWAEEFGDSKRHKNQRDTMHMVLSMPEGTEPEAVRSAARQFTKRTFGQNYEYVFALHEDEPHPHVHVTVKCLGFDGRRLNPRKADLQLWREGFAETMREEGVEAEASPRRSRGVVKKAVKSVIQHIERGDKSHPPRVPKVKAEQIREAAQELAAEAKGQMSQAKPWEQQIAARQAAVRRAWLAAAQALEQPKPPIVYKKEPQNGANYDRFDSRHAGGRARTLRADVQKPGFGESQPRQPAQSITGMRNLSGIGLVHHQGSTQMLLQPNARNSLGRPGRRPTAASHDVRRTRDSDYGDDRGAKSVSKGQGVPLPDKALAERIRGLVGAMPPIVTQKHEVKRQLAEQFKRSPDLARISDPPAGVEPVQPTPKPDRDIER